ncbi:MAG: YIP1 family protein [Nanoarchaeota archaeon]|nr:YIP1 family protein [Nanoarchaeota archaeon]
MNFLHYIKQALKIIIIDKKAIREVAKDKKATVPAIIFSIIGLLIYAYVSFVKKSSLGGIYLDFLLSVLMIVGMLGLIHLLARLFGSKDKFIHFFRPIMLFSLFDIIYLLVLIPKISVLTSIIFLIWGIIVNFVVIKEAYRLSTGRSIGVLVLSFLALIFIFIMISMVVGMIFFAQNPALYMPK